jgi:hypothetical protein
VPCQGNHHQPAICCALYPANKPVLHRTLDQSYHRMVPFLKKFGKFRERGGATTGKSSDAEHQLVLLWSHSELSGCVFTKAKKFAQGIAKPSKIADEVLDFKLVLTRGTPPGTGLGIHGSILSYCEQLQWSGAARSVMSATGDGNCLRCGRSAKGISATLFMIGVIGHRSPLDR